MVTYVIKLHNRNLVFVCQVATLGKSLTNSNPGVVAAAAHALTSLGKASIGFWGIGFAGFRGRVRNAGSRPGLRPIQVPQTPCAQIAYIQACWCASHKLYVQGSTLLNPNP